MRARRENDVETAKICQRRLPAIFIANVPEVRLERAMYDLDDVVLHKGPLFRFPKPGHGNCATVLRRPQIAGQDARMKVACLEERHSRTSAKAIPGNVGNAV